MDPDEAQSIHEFDEELTEFLDVCPGALHSFYNALVSEGFDNTEAMVLTQTWFVNRWC